MLRVFHRATSRSTCLPRSRMGRVSLASACPRRRGFYGCTLRLRCSFPAPQRACDLHAGRCRGPCAANHQQCGFVCAWACACDGCTGVSDVANASHLPPRPVQLVRWMNDTDLGGGDYNLTHHAPGSGDTPATCQALCDSDARCDAWTWVVRGAPAGAADCCRKSADHVCPHPPAPHPCGASGCRLTSGVKRAGPCTPPSPQKPVAFSVASNITPMLPANPYLATRTRRRSTLLHVGLAFQHASSSCLASCFWGRLAATFAPGPEEKN